MAEKRDFMQHWPVIALAVVVLGIFLAACVSFQVQEYEVAIRKTFGKARMDSDGKIKIYKPGLHFQWPAPIDQIWKHDNRIQCYELETGRVEQIQTRDEYMVVVTTFVLWRVGDPGLFMRAITTSKAAENSLDDLVRNSRNTVFGRHDLARLIQVRDLGELTSTNQDELDAIENEILQDVKTRALEDFGIDILHVGVKHLGFPEQVTKKVFARMRAERERKVSEHLSEGESKALGIRAEADRERREIITTAEAKAKGIRSQGDEEAAKEYAAFAENPELAVFLRKLESLRKTLQKKDTLVLDTKTPPFDILNQDATDFATEAAKRADKQADKKDAAK
jgi:membrane protease subunit HflC